MSGATSKLDAIVAGHITLDIIPTFKDFNGDVHSLLVPGKLTEVGSPLIATGGTVSNTGLALHRLGVPTGLIGKIGDDVMGKAVLERIRAHDPGLAEDMVVSAEDDTSYSIVISPPGVDRMFLHCPGANDTFEADNIDYEKLDGARLFHFGYPPLMRRMYGDDGKELESLLSRAKQKGVIVSLDMAMPDPASPAGKVNWTSILERALPSVDVFLPSFDEILYMLDRDRFDRMRESDGDNSPGMMDGLLLSEIAQRLFDYGPAIVVLKLGDKGLYVRTTPDDRRLAKPAKSLGVNLESWATRELLSGCFEADVVGTTGAGDCTIAGFLAGLLKGQQPHQALTSAVAVGACSVERADATSGVPSWNDVQARITSGWKRSQPLISLPDWRTSDQGEYWIGPNDRTSQ